jgi:hypothetical protein
VSPSSPLIPHVLVFCLAVGSASYVWLRDKAPAASTRRDVVVWRGRAADVSRVELKKPGRRVVLEAKTDATGRYFLGLDEPAPGGAPSTSSAPINFVSVAAAQKLADKLGELRAARDLGRLDDAKAGEVGLTSPDVRLTITVGGEEHALDVGGSAPGDTDRYVRDTKTGSVFVVASEPIRDLEAGEHALVEGDLHEFPLDPDVDRVVVVQGDKRRTLVRRGAALKRFFADAASPETNDETATTWMAKIERLRALDFVLSEPPGMSSPRLRIEYEKNKRVLGFLEVVRSTPLAGAEADVFIRTERTRLWAKANRQLGEQVLGDVASILR